MEVAGELKPADGRASGVPPWAWGLPVLLLAAALGALALDEPLRQMVRAEALRDRLFHLSNGLIGVTVFVALVSVALSAENWARRGIALAVLVVGGGLFGALMDWGVEHRPTGTTQIVHGLITGAVGWGTVFGLFAVFRNRRRLCAGFAATLAVSTGLTHLVKLVVGRARPFTDLGLLHFNPLHLREGEFESFPSGHSSAAAALVGVLIVLFPRRWYLLLAYPLAVGFERIVADKHFLSDVLAGFAVGVLAVLAARRMLGARFFTARAPEAGT